MNPTEKAAFAALKQELKEIKAAVALFARGLRELVVPAPKPPSPTDRKESGKNGQ